jgi:hypothetical protein
MRLVRFGLLLAIGVMALVAAAREASACSCVERSFAAHAKAENRVFLARAGKPVKNGDALQQKFTILSTFKGPKESEFLLDRPATPPCASNYAENEIAILFTSDGDLDPCHGNRPFVEQAPHLAAILKAVGTAKKAGDAKAIEVALGTVLKPYLHQRPRIGVHHAPLAGKSFQLDKSKLVYEKTGGANSVKITSAVTTGTVTFVTGRYDREGLRFSAVLLLGSDNKWTVIDSSAVET